MRFYTTILMRHWRWYHNTTLMSTIIKLSFQAWTPTHPKETHKILKGENLTLLAHMGEDYFLIHMCINTVVILFNYNKTP